MRLHSKYWCASDISDHMGNAGSGNDGRRSSISQSSISSSSSSSSASSSTSGGPSSSSVSSGRLENGWWCPSVDNRLAGIDGTLLIAQLKSLHALHAVPVPLFNIIASYAMRPYMVLLVIIDIIIISPPNVTSYV